ncbi:MAG: hypothetical protein ABEH78_01945 [Haloferacaceae archaeon]
MAGSDLVDSLQEIFLPEKGRDALKRNWYRPTWWATNAIPFVLMRGYFEVMKYRGTDIVEEDWDNLIILDACRYDHFRELSPVPGRLESRWSMASSTGLFLRRNFEHRTCHDTVYVTGNPMYRAEQYGYDESVGRSTFHDTVDVWETDWDEEFNTVRPEAMVDPSKEAHDEYADKRLIVHFLQPHAPFIGETGERIKRQSGSGVIANMVEDAERRGGKPVWSLVQEGVVDVETARQAYRENVEIALPHVAELVSHFEGKTVITADHGELLGEMAWPIPYRQYGHPNRVWTKHLTRVPWHVVEGDSRREITSDPPPSNRSQDDRPEIEEKLSHLGYK